MIPTNPNYLKDFASRPRSESTSIDDRDKSEAEDKIRELAFEKTYDAHVKGIKLISLVKDIRNETGYGYNTILSTIINLQDKRVLVLRENVPFARFRSYAFSPLAIWFWEATVATLLSLALIEVTGGALIYFRYIFGSLIIFFLPGYALVSLLFSKRDDTNSLFRIALSVGLSISMVTVIGLVLNFTSTGLGLVPVAFTLSAVTLILLLVSLSQKFASYKLSQKIREV